VLERRVLVCVPNSEGQSGCVHREQVQQPTRGTHACVSPSCFPSRTFCPAARMTTSIPTFDIPLLLDLIGQDLVRDDIQRCSRVCHNWCTLSASGQRTPSLSRTTPPLVKSIITHHSDVFRWLGENPPLNTLEQERTSLCATLVYMQHLESTRMRMRARSGYFCLKSPLDTSFHSPSRHRSSIISISGRLFSQLYFLARLS